MPKIEKCILVYAGKIYFSFYINYKFVQFILKLNKFLHPFLYFQNDKYFPNTNERPCYIEGVPEDIVKAIQTIQEKLANDNPRRGTIA